MDSFYFKISNSHADDTMPPKSFYDRSRVESDLAVDPKVLCLGRISEDALKALQQANQKIDTYPETKARPRCTIFYMCQSLQDLGNESDRFNVPIYISKEGDRVNQKWCTEFDKAIDKINEVAPGLNLYEVCDKDTAKIRVVETSVSVPRTDGNILSSPHATIYLCHDWSNMERSSVHELFHALGFKHEHERRDKEKSITLQTFSSRYVHNPSNDILGATRFDPFSIMLYSERNFHKKPLSDAAWNLKTSTATNKKMSELDKVGLNLLYRPCKGPNYNPRVSDITGMWYCGRRVMKDHNIPSKSITDSCGPNVSANCHACRTLKNDRITALWNDGKWQGWSGLVYCGENSCGPDSGPPCPECKKILAVP